MEFRQGFIEDPVRGAGIQDGTIDLIISNCVINLSPSKHKVLEAAFNALKSGGELYFSDVYADRRLSDAARTNATLAGQVTSAALCTVASATLSASATMSGSRVPVRCRRAPLRWTTRSCVR